MEGEREKREMEDGEGGWRGERERKERERMEGEIERERG